MLKFVCTHVCTSICFPVTISIMRLCVYVYVCVCAILPLKIINTGVVSGRPAAYSAWLSTMPQKWLHSPIHSSIPSL